MEELGSPAWDPRLRPGNDWRDRKQLGKLLPLFRGKRRRGSHDLLDEPMEVLRRAGRWNTRKIPQGGHLAISLVPIGRLDSNQLGFAFRLGCPYALGLLELAEAGSRYTRVPNPKRPAVFADVHPAGPAKASPCGCKRSASS